MIPQSLVDVLGAIVGVNGLLTDTADMAPYCTDWRDQFHGSALCVAFPRTTDQVAAIVRHCAEEGITIVPSGGNSGLSGGATPDTSGRQLILSLSRMNAIREIDPVGETIEVEAGCILQTAQRAVAEVGLLLPITLAAEGSAQIGGIVSTNAGGTNVLRYGMARSRVLGLEAVLANGQIVSGLRKLRKDNAGYDWKQWLIGTEGTLAIITAAVLQLAPAPRARVTALLAVPSTEAVLDLLRTARQWVGDTLNGFELMSGQALELVDRHLQRKNPLVPTPWYILLEASSSLSSLHEDVEALLASVLERGIAIDGVVAQSEREQAALWALRESITEGEAKEGRSFKHDVSVPISRIPSFLKDADAAVADAFPGTQINAFGHAGDGNIHYNVIPPVGANGGAINRLIHDIVIAHGGSISAEHGIGQYRVDELYRCKGAAEIDLAARIKQALDPEGLLNPGKVLKPYVPESKS